MLGKTTVYRFCGDGALAIWGCGGDNGNVGGANDSSTACEHIWGEWETAKEPTCTDVGEERKVCLLCGEFEIYETAALMHNTETHEGKEATCTEFGWYNYEECIRSGCDYTTYEEISALGHEEINHEAQEATCTEIGWNAYVTCGRCDDTTYEEISAKA